MPLVPIKHDAEVRHRHVFSIYLIEVQRLTARIEMRDELMSEEIEVDPFVRTAPFRAAETPAIEAPGDVQVVNRDRQVKWCRHGATINRALPR
jgi:hypothetical protein